MERHAALLFGYGWKSALAEALDISRKTVGRWIAEDAVPGWAAERIRAMAHIAPPPGSTAAEDRDAACRLALEPEITRIVGMAEAAGWHRAEIVVALLAMTVDDLLDHAGEEATAGLLREALAQVGGRA